MKKQIFFAFFVVFSILFCHGIVSKADNGIPVITTYPEAFVDFETKSTITFGTLNNTDNVSIKECGILYSSDNGNMTLNDNGVRKFVHEKELNTKGQFGIKLTDAENILGKSYYTRCYAIYEQSGSEHIIYADKSVFIKAEPTVITADISELAALTEKASPGDEFIIKNGTYDNVSFSVSGEGRYGLPIRIKAETPGKVIFTENTDITLSGKYLELSGIRFENIRSDTSVVKLNSAIGCRVTECYFYDIFGKTTTFVTCVSASNVSQKNRVDHNVFERTGGGLSIAVGYNEDSLNFDNRLDHNYFKDVPWVNDLFPGQLNGFEQAAAGGAKTHDHITPRYIIEDNLFENIIGDKSEIICIKSSENIIRYNTFLNCNMSEPDFRNGGSCVFEGNFCINSKSGIRSYGANQVIKNNYFYNCERGVVLGTTDEGNILEEGSQYRQSKNVTVEGNMFIYPGSYGINLGSGYNPITYYMDVPEHTKVKDNIFVTDRAPAIVHSNSVFDDFSGNIVSLSGSGTVGTDSEGFETKELKLVYDGQIYIPEGMSIDKRGLKTPDDVGPIGNWWRELLKNPSDDIRASVEYRSSMPNSYTPSKTEIVLIEGETYNLGNISGRANYSDMSFNALSENIRYSISNNSIATVTGLELKGIKEGTANLFANLNGRTVMISVKVVKSSVDETKTDIYSNDFEKDNSLNNFSNQGVWKRVNGKLTNAGISTEMLRMTLDNSLKLEGDFVLEFEMTAKPLGDTDSGNVNSSVILGYKENNYPEYYRIDFSDSLISETAITKNNDSISNVVGVVTDSIEKNKTHNIEIRKNKNMLSVVTDGKLSAVAYVPENISGRIGFASTKITEIDNITVRRPGESTHVDTRDMEITYERTDVSEIKLNYGITDSEVIYRICKNNIWYTDTTATEFVDDGINPGTDYLFEVFAYNKNGGLEGKGKINLNLSEETDEDLFQITDCCVRTGPDGSYDYDTYIIRNKGLSSNQRIYCDRVYTFGDTLPERFENAAYIMTRAEDNLNSYVQNEATTDFVKFRINKSATVYLLVLPNAYESVPNWLTSNGWSQTGIQVSDYSQVFAKHYEVSDSSGATIEIGGFKGKLPMMYSIVVVPEEMPEDLRITDCLTKTGEGGTFERDVCTVINSGLSSESKMYTDRVYTYGEELHEKFKNAAHIITRNNDIYNAELQNADTSDFIKFNINKSSTVYLLVNPNGNNTVPGWITDNGWILTAYQSGSFTKIFAKHYKVVDGSGATVEIGGFKGKLPMMYTIVIVPEDTPEDLFAVTECLAKTGTDGAYESGVYTVVNNGFKNGCQMYSDRTYTYEGIPSELENSAYIMTRNNDIYNTALQSGNTSDFIKFNINKSATVYILLYPNGNYISSSTHPWIKDWSLTGYTAGSFTKIYKRHYDVACGNKVTVSTGGFKGKLPSMYAVVIKPD